MKLILGNPGSGKTKRILELSAKNRIPVLCESQARVERVLVKAAGYGYKIPTPICLDELKEGMEVYIDDVKRFMEIALKCKLSGIAVNTSEETEFINLQ